MLKLANLPISDEEITSEKPLKQKKSLEMSKDIVQNGIIGHGVGSGKNLINNDSVYKIKSRGMLGKRLFSG